MKTKVAIVIKPFLSIAEGQRFLVNEQNELMDGDNKVLPIELTNDFFKVEEVENRFANEEWVNYNKEDGKVIAVQVLGFDPITNTCMVKSSRKNSKEFAVDIKLLSKSEKYFFIKSDGTVGSAIYGADAKADAFRKKMQNIYDTEALAIQYVESLG